MAAPFAEIYGQAKTFAQVWKADSGLYVQRKLLNADELLSWAKAAGIPNLVPADQMHVTNVYSRKGVTLTTRTIGLTVEGGARSIEPLGDKGAVVLMFESKKLNDRWQEAADAGATWDYETGYHPHVTLSYDAGGKDLSALKAPDTPLQFGPEIHEPINENWAEDNGLRVAKTFAQIFKDYTRSDVHVPSTGPKKAKLFSQLFERTRRKK